MSQFLKPCPVGTVENINGDCVRQQYLRPFFQYGSSYGSEDQIKTKCKTQMGKDCEKCGNFANAKIYPKCETGYSSPGENAPYTECEYCAPAINTSQVMLPRSGRLSNLVNQQEFTTLNTRFSDFDTNFNKRVMDIYLPDYNKSAQRVQQLADNIEKITGQLNSLLAVDVNGTLQRLTANITAYEKEAKKAVEEKGSQIENLTKVLTQVKGDNSKTNELIAIINKKIADRETLIAKFIDDRKSEIDLITNKLSDYLDQNQINALISQKIASIQDIYASKEFLDKEIRNLSSIYLTQAEFQKALENASKF